MMKYNDLASRSLNVSKKIISSDSTCEENELVLEFKIIHVLDQYVQKIVPP